MQPARSKPEWLKIRPPGGERYRDIKRLLHSLKLHTVCEEAHCPNVAECWGGGTATVMLMGDVCTRGCKFCHVKSGNPRGVLDPNEPDRVARAISTLGLTYVVLTSVNRDDLVDGGAGHISRTVEAIKALDPRVIVEVLIPDFQADRQAIQRVVDSGADVIAHNIETIERLTPSVRDGKASYRQSLDVLQEIKNRLTGRHTKSSIMVGLGESFEEVCQTMDDLRSCGVDLLTVGQYLRPSQWHLPVHEFITPEVFKQYEMCGLEKAFLFVASGPLVRSSYRAGEHYVESIVRGNQHASH